jgi:tetratricopeptide (TPR) repeat protein
MPKWTAFPYPGEYPFDVASVQQNWARLHAGDKEPLPKSTKLLEAWALFHSGEFERAADAGRKAGHAAATIVYKATSTYAYYLAATEKSRLELLTDVALMAHDHAVREPQNASAHYWHAYALGRYGQSISVARALVQGLGGKVKAALEAAIAAQPLHADARIALGLFHAEVIDKVGVLIGSMTYGVKKDTGLRLFQEAFKLNPKSAIGMLEYGRGLNMLEGDAATAEALSLFDKAAKTKPWDAMERLHADMAHKTWVEAGGRPSLRVVR